MNASVAIQTLPEAKDNEELIRIVDEVIDYIKSTGLHYYVGPFETAIEGDVYKRQGKGSMAGRLPRRMWNRSMCSAKARSLAWWADSLM